MQFHLMLKQRKRKLGTVNEGNFITGCKADEKVFPALAFQRNAFAEACPMCLHCQQRANQSFLLRDQKLLGTQRVHH